MGLLVSNSSLNSVKCNASEQCVNISLSPEQMTETAVQCQGRGNINLMDTCEVSMTNSTKRQVNGCAVSVAQPSGSDKHTTLQQRTSEADDNYTTTTITDDVACAARGASSMTNVKERERTMADIVRETNTGDKCKQNIANSEDVWIKVQRKKTSLRNRFTSETGRANCDLNFKAASCNKIPLYISNVCKTTTESDIVNYILTKTNELVVLEKINGKKERDYNSFKIFVSRHKLPLFMNSAIWPEGICFRRFVLFNKGRLSSESSNKPSQQK